MSKLTTTSPSALSVAAKTIDELSKSAMEAFASPCHADVLLEIANK